MENRGEDVTVITQQRQVLIIAEWLGIVYLLKNAR